MLQELHGCGLACTRDLPSTTTCMEATPLLCALQEIVFFEEGEPLMDGEPGDLKFVVRTRPHSRFQRAGADLAHNLTISLVDALTGFSTQARPCP